jgi:hypothetical protein
MLGPNFTSIMSDAPSENVGSRRQWLSSPGNTEVEIRHGDFRQRGVKTLGGVCGKPSEAP